MIDLGASALPMTKRMTKRTTKASKQSTRKRAASPPSLAMHSAASPEWGTPMLLRRFGARVLAPAAMGRAIDLDYATSSYWQQ